MGGILDALHELQEIERQLADFRARVDSKRRQVRIHERSLEKQNALIDLKNQAILQTQIEIDRLDLDVKTRDDQVLRHRQALNAAKTNKEYTAILTAMNTEKADSGKLESQQLQFMSEMDVLRGELAELEADRETVKKRVAFAQSKVDECVEQTRADVDRLQAERDKRSSSIDPSIIAVFNRVADRHEGDAMAEVRLINEKRQEYGCGGCNIAVTLEMVLNLNARDEIMTCQSCGMILFLPQGLRAAT
jgi:predicted  nucleic acid-binding Zn-ribbon protein